MRITIVGDGKVGFALAEQLSKEKHDVTIIDKNAAALQRADDALDVLCIEGNGASVRVQQEAGVPHTDLLIAATSSDEMNMVCCLLGRKLGAKNTIARIRNPEYTQDLPLLQKELGLTMVINPEEAVAREIARVLRFLHADSIEPFARGRLELVGFRVQPTDLIVGTPLVDCVKRLPHDVLFCAVERDDDVLIPNGETVIRAGDIAHVIGQPADLHQFFKVLGRGGNKVHNVMIVGGGKIAHYLAKDLLATDKVVKVIELHEEAALQLSSELPDVLVIRGDGTDVALLESEGLQQMDAFVALTDRDEENMMIALHAHECGLRKVVTKINRLNYMNLIHRLGVDSVFSPKLVAANRIVRYVRSLENAEGSAIETLLRIAGNKAEALEFEACAQSRLVGQPLRHLPLKRDVLIAALVRDGRIVIPRGDSVIQAKDRVIAITRDLTVIDLNDLLEGKS